MEPGSADVRVRSWAPTERTLDVTAQQESLLTVAQSANPGWQARVGGSVLDPVAVDGWKQGWRVPAGTSGKVTLRFTPQATFEWGIVIGFVLVGLLSLAALVTLILSRGRRSQRGRGARVAPNALPAAARHDDSSVPSRLVLVVGAGVLALVSFPLGIGAVAGFISRRVSLAAISATCASGLVVAAATTLGDVGGPVSPPVVADIVTALVIGLVSGRVLFGGDRSESDPT